MSGYVEIAPFTERLPSCIASICLLLLRHCVRVPAIPAAMEHVVLRALAKDPTERFANVHAFARALEEAVKTESSSRTLFVFASDSLEEFSAQTEHRLDQLHVRFYNLPAQLTPLIGREQEIQAV